jgi:hypothetical protein
LQLMKIVMTMMVRDEADIIGAMIEHHLAQGVDHFIATDNGSVDGTTAILERYRDAGVLDLREDPVHRKQQAPTVTAMARDAYTLYGADWVLNADADEFWLAKDRRKTLREALKLVPTSIRAFPVPVIDMIGEPAMEGAGIGRLIYRDLRSVDKLVPLGLLSHSTPDVAHVGSATVNVVQGNHFVDIEAVGTPPAGGALEVLHLPWRSWGQYSRKVSNAGRAYENNSGLTPSPNHHGMRDYRRLQAGSLFGWYLLRHPTRDEIDAGLATGEFAEDRTLENLPGAAPDESIVDPSARAQRALAAAAGQALSEVKAAELRERALRDEISEAYKRIDTINAELVQTHEDLRAERDRKIVRLANSLRHAAEGLRGSH